MAKRMREFIRIDPELCSGCQRCHTVCPVDAIEGEPGEPQKICGDACVMCGQCVQICSAYDAFFEKDADWRVQKLRERNMPDGTNEPLFAAHYRGNFLAVKEILMHKNKFTMVQCAPAIRVALAEEFGMPLGSLVPGKMAAALRRLGFDRIYDTNFAADLTIMEEGSELIKRLTEGGTLPMFTSCCPAWVKFIEDKYPELVGHLSSCKSPQQMAGAIFKTYGAGLDGVAGENIYSVAIMPCTCKSFEAGRQEMKASGYQDVDAVLTTRELGYLIKEAGIDFAGLPEEEFDKPLGIYSGAGNIFGVTGGVMEAAIRSAYEMVSGKPLDSINVTSVRGEIGVRRTIIDAGEFQLKTVVVSGLKNVLSLLETVKQGNAEFDFMEVMTCPSGCISGGGQPKMLLPLDVPDAYHNRRNSLYRHDEELTYRQSHENPEIKTVYEQFLGEPLGHQSHKLLHTSYKASS
ncbi:MAG: hydrogenase, Fe-only [Firmicutes bacterium]|nr:hydrogenase, Fe-only [Bacillota bacterium]